MAMGADRGILVDTAAGVEPLAVAKLVKAIIEKEKPQLVIPVGNERRCQELVRITRVSEHEFKTVDIADVRFVPLVGE